MKTPEPTTMTEPLLYESAGKLADSLSTSLEWIMDAAYDAKARLYLHARLDHELDRIGRLQEQRKEYARRARAKVS